jgi:hypothetical protein
MKFRRQMPLYKLLDHLFEINMQILLFLLQNSRDNRNSKTNISNEILANFALYSVFYSEFSPRNVGLYNIILTF